MCTYALFFNKHLSFKKNTRKTKHDKSKLNVVGKLVYNIVIVVISIIRIFIVAKCFYIYY